MQRLPSIFTLKVSLKMYYSGVGFFALVWEVFYFIWEKNLSSLFGFMAPGVHKLMDLSENIQVLAGLNPITLHKENKPFPNKFGIFLE